MLVIVVVKSLVMLTVVTDVEAGAVSVVVRMTVCGGPAGSVVVSTTVSGGPAGRVV